MQNKPDIWLRNKSETVADCRVFKVRKDFCRRENSDAESTFFVCENPDWVNVIALNENGEVVLIEQFRHGIEKIILEIPGGMIDGAEDSQTGAMRELLEETGFTSEKWVFLGESNPNPAIQNNRMFHYLALDCRKSGETEFDEHESVVTKLVPLADCEKLIETGEIAHSLVVAAFYYYHLYGNKKLA